ncbi:MAG TPA: MucB/RseB C-terminal domain-containing protein [Rhodocyclaceae bacterium]|nr:MucB/RseB C-terminal domain-containing protein [Rhodocyclaceae bacterium]
MRLRGGFFRTWISLALLAFACNVGAQTITGQDTLMWLQRMNKASRGINYSGTFVYQSHGRTETSHVVHVVDASGEHEKLETLETPDGQPREVIRTNDEVLSYLPQDRLVIVDRADVGGFPGRLINTMGALSDFYSMHLGDVSRIAGRDAQLLVLEPRDEMRYGHELWADVLTGLLLKARMVNDKTEAVEQFEFNDISIGGYIDHDKIKSRYSHAADWVVVNARGTEVHPEDVNWVFRGLPPGFKQISFVRRPLKREGPEAYHAVFSDGLATISVFVEPSQGRSMSVPPTASLAGSIGIYKRIMAEYQVTTLGEVPMAALKHVAEGVELRKK